ncbi:MAG: peptide chain release factor 2 [Alphaproteobacteria bacterium RIFCSPLOWO2_01_FULL_40_26]|nr:MAG: peptide chain release factor 2 [Alphaproteobacteria bacterium RIFCSPHIGHO2_02_FULL_40_34]OFW95537.1 MAG: peptide chain release factor 2 [Alphaproteobacteria bacterium RIFCSPLOWO2_01_FULL_40_26]OFX09623.1 MAG: peptide chain release factor 2 [Alphaproteobacteria bacterium RIFCSPLOWO2_02_FULL_40_19]OFX11336.1 MAG: peptide chain release factor 2 [Alphaproteobacteria bacterium RIFCSPLOWO2_12_FULL_40_11]
MLFRGVFDPEKLRVRFDELNKKSEDPELWNNKLEAQKILKEKSLLDEKLNQFLAIENGLKDNREYFDLAKSEADAQLLSDIEKNLLELKKKSDAFEIECLFSGENDANNCFLDINAGAGGTDSCDFGLMLLRMYERFANRHKFKVEIVSMLDGEEAGIRSATLKISGKYAFGWLRKESGVHRLVRISPFNANDKRQTSFTSVWVYPEIDDEIEIEVLEKDLRVDTFRASGAGGQHVNKTDSAVRMTHLPTNIVVQCQSDRSQLRNRAECMKMLKSRLYELEMQKKKDAQAVSEAAKTDNSWGHQIRSYVLHPYQLVKDLRTDFETGNIQAVLDGELDGFIKAALTEKK